MSSNLNPAQALERRPLVGRWVRLEPIDPHRHAEALFLHAHHPDVPDLWTYMSSGPFRHRAEFDAYLQAGVGPDPLFFAVLPEGRPQPEGLVAFLRIKPTMACLEIGHIWFGTSLRRTRAATEALFLLIEHAIANRGYRRVEWKCDDRNRASRQAARRLGFRHEGLFRQHMIIKGGNRDTAWYSITDGDWKDLAPGFRAWLAADNFDHRGHQRTRLEAMLARTA